MYRLPGWGDGWGRAGGDFPGGAALADLLARLEILTDQLLALQTELRRLLVVPPSQVPAGGEPFPLGLPITPTGGAPRASPQAPPQGLALTRPVIRHSPDGRSGSITFVPLAPFPAGGSRAWPPDPGAAGGEQGVPSAWFRLSDHPGG